MEMEVEMNPESATCLKEEQQDNTDLNTSNDDVTVSWNKPNVSLVNCKCIVSQVKDRLSDMESVSSNSSSSQSSSATNRKCCIKQRLCTVLNSGISNDVLFIVGEGKEQQRIHAIKALLTAGSDVFSAMFGQNWSSNSAEIEVPDIKPSIFTALLRFLYTDEVSLSSENVIGLLYAARKYDVEPLLSRCVDFLVESLCSDNAFTILEHGRLLDIQKLINSSLDTIDVDTATAVATDDFCNIDIDTLCLILVRDTLTIPEVKLFEALLSWSMAECARKNMPINKENQRSVLGGALTLIRFPLMSAEEFSYQVADTGLLTNEVLLSMYEYFIKNARSHVIFNDTPRFCKELIINRFKKFELDSPCTGLGNSIYFTCDRDVLLLGYGMFGSQSGPAKYEVTLGLMDSLTNNCLRHESGTYEIDGTEITYRALFINPLKLTALKKYRARVNVKGPDTFIGREGLEELTVDLPHSRKLTITFETYVDKNVPNPRTTVDGGLIPQLILAA